MSIAQQLRHERRRRGLTLDGLAELMHVGAACIGSWERESRKPSIDQADYWAGVFGLRLGLVPNVDELPVEPIGDLVRVLSALAELAPTLAEMVEGIGLVRERADAEAARIKTLVSA